LGARDNTAFVLDVGGAERVRVNSSGFVGIANSAPTAALQIDGSTNASCRIIINDPNSQVIPTISLQQGGVAKGTIEAGWGVQNRMDFSITNTPRMMTLINGRVGIGSENPGQKLQVEGNIMANGAIMAT